MPWGRQGRPRECCEEPWLRVAQCCIAAEAGQRGALERAGLQCTGAAQGPSCSPGQDTSACVGAYPAHPGALCLAGL